MQKTIGVVHGGLSHERQKSLEYGKQISKVLQNLGFNVLDLHLHPNGSWTVNGDVQNIEESLKKVDKIWNCLVGVDGERGIVEGLCEKCRVKMVGHSKLHSHMSSDKKNMHHLLHQHGIKYPFGKVLKKKDFSKEKVLEIFSSVPLPAIVKPNNGSSLWAVQAVNNFPEMQKAIENIITQDEDVLVEKLVKGTPVACFVFDHKNLLHTHIKVDGEIPLSKEQLVNIRNEALYIHNVLGMSHHAEYDFLVTPKGLVFLEVNTHPSLVSGYIKDVFKNGQVPLSDYVSNKL